MNKPPDLVQLLEDLSQEQQRSAVETLRTSFATLYLGNADDKGVKLSEQECRLLFDSRSTVRRLADALANADAAECSLTLVDLSIPDDVRDELERSFASVDEE